MEPIGPYLLFPIGKGNPMRQTPFDIAARMIEEFGDRAKFLVDEHVDIALQADDPTGFEDWCLVGKALALLTQPNRIPGVTERNSEEDASASVAGYVATRPERRARSS
jgi:hypothetical protein